MKAKLYIYLITCIFILPVFGCSVTERNNDISFDHSAVPAEETGENMTGYVSTKTDSSESGETDAITALPTEENLLFPGESWARYASPEEAGYSSEKIAEAKKYYDSLGSSAVLVVYDGAILIEWGSIEKKYECRSVRKSFLSALYGIHAERGEIDLSKTLEELDIDDEPPLTQSEKQAKVSDLLKARSGVYHAAAYEGLVKFPERGSHAPGSYWFYKNWDFNTLGTIFEQETKVGIFEGFKECIADPLAMEDFDLEDTEYVYSKRLSVHPAYTFKMSARDMARFGLLYLRKGRWNDQQIVPEKWIDESTASYSNTKDIYGGYGYMWWVNNDKSPFKELGAYSALGTGTQSIDVVPGAKLVFVHRTDTNKGINICCGDTLELLKMILDAKVSEPKENPALVIDWFEPAE